jgi:hypothetical protein
MEAVDDQAVIASSAGRFFGPASLRSAMGTTLIVEVDKSLRCARLALAYPYRAQIDDVVLVLGHQEALYVLGVIDGKGATQLDFPGNVELRAAGHLRIQARAGFELDSTRIVMRANRLDIAVRTVRESVTNLYRRVQGTIRTVAGRERTTIEGQSTLHAGRIVRKSTDDVVVDGRQIKLG